MLLLSRGSENRLLEAVASMGVLIDSWQLEHQNSYIKKNMHHGTQVVKVHNQNEIFKLIVVLRTKKSLGATISSTTTILIIFSYSVEYSGTQGE